MSKPEDSSKSGREIKGYRIFKPIGQGKFSIVYKAERLSDGLPVAIKIIKVLFIQIFDMMDPKQRDKCLKEVSLLESLKHPNIINYLDSFIEENELLIAIEWAEKGDLKRIIKRAQADELPLEELKIWEYMYQIASALKHMQEKRIMHRDLKPANIFITADGSLKLGDLGLGRFLSSQTIEAFSRVGTPLYMSPEVLKGSGYDWKSDVWSLGCVVYELACLKSPFRKDDTKMSLYDLFQTISKGEFTPVGERYSEELRTIVNSMIQVNAEKRLDIDQVVELCKIQLNSWTSKKPKVDISLVMDDIQEKLKLLDYENVFCRTYQHPPMARIYFSHQIHPTEQLCYFYDLVYWLMSLNKTKSPSLRPYTPVISSSSIGDSEEIAKHILADVKSFGLKSAETITPVSIKQGWGEGVCIIINDLLNRELVRQDYKFLMPVINEGGKNVYKATVDSEDIFEVINFEMPESMLWEDQEEANVPEEKETPPTNNTTGISDLQYVEKEDERRAILETNVDPVEWFEEAKRVSSRLVLNRDDIGSESRVDEIKKTCANIKKILQDPLVAAFLQKKAEALAADLERILAGEKKMHKLCEGQIQDLRAIAEKRVEILRRLTEKRNKVAELCEVFEKVQAGIERLNQEITEKGAEHKAGNKIASIKSAMLNLRNDVKMLSNKIAIARNQLDAYRIN